MGFDHKFRKGAGSRFGHNQEVMTKGQGVRVMIFGCAFKGSEHQYMTPLAQMLCELKEDEEYGM